MMPRAPDDTAPGALGIMGKPSMKSLKFLLIYRLFFIPH